MLSSGIIRVSRMLVASADEVIVVPQRPVLGAYRTAATAVEGSSIIFEVRRSGVQTGGCSCTWTAVSAAGTADLAAPTTGTVTFGNGVTAPVRIAVKTNNRSGTQGDRAVTITISNGQGADLDPTRLSAVTTLQDSTAPVNWWQLATTRGGRADKRASGPSYWAASGSSVANFALYEKQVGLMDAMNGGTSDKGGISNDTMLLITGGPLNPVNTTITAKSQLDWTKNDGHWTTGWRNAAAGCWCVWSLNLIGIDRRTDLGDNSIWEDIINGMYANAYISMGMRIKANIDGGVGSNPKGHAANRLILRLNHENNQTNFYQVNPPVKLRYKLATEKSIDWIRQGLGNYGQLVKFAHAPAHGSSFALGVYDSWCPNNVDLYAVSWHTTGIWNGTSLTGGIDTPAQVAAYMAGTDGGADSVNRYGPEEIATLARAHNPPLPIMFPEWSPKCEWSGGGLKNACPMSNTSVIAFDQFLSANQDITVCDCVYSKLGLMEMLTPTGYQGPDAAGIQQWKDMVPNFKTRWGKPNKGP